MAKCRVLTSGVCAITQPYHINGQKGYNYDHWGIDIVDFSQGYHALGWVCAHSEGTVVETRNNCTGFEQNSYGNYVMIRHPNNMFTLYAHGSYNTVQVSVGQKVVAGQKLFYMGNTGTSYGGHLHFEVRQSNGYKIDPEGYLYNDLPNMSSLEWIKVPVWILRDTTTGKSLKGWQEVNGKWYYLDPATGIMKTGWWYDPNYKGWFYLDPTNGDMQTGWVKVKGKWYFLARTTTGSDVKGKMKTGWLKDKNKWYYLNPKATSQYKEGEMFTGTHIIDGKTYYFDNNGALLNP